MNTKQLEALQVLENRKFETAKAIRKLLDELEKELGEKNFNECQLEEEILNLVTGEDE